VKFPSEFDALDLVTDELKGKMMPVSRRLKEVEKERAERRKVRKRTKAAKTTKDKDVEMGDATTAVLESVPSGSAIAENTAASESTTTTGEEGKGKETAAGELEEESVYRQNEIKELEALVDPDLKNDVGCSLSGLYDLVGEHFTLLFLFRPWEMS
jgi:ubiquitin carboxyl-terminal hydrolase 14